MITYVYVFFLPGAAGSFFARCLSLASDRCVGQISRTAETPYMQQQEKFQLYQYNHSKQFNNWVTFEKSITHYSDLFEHSQIIDNSVSIWSMHPDYTFLNKDIAGIEDQQLVVYIDPSRAFEWCLLNALYKDSFIQKNWMACGHQMLEDSNILKVDMCDIISSCDTLLLAVQTVCSAAGIDIAPENQQLICKLWHQWIGTTLQPHSFEQFKRSIGFYKS